MEWKIFKVFKVNDRNDRNWRDSKRCFNSVVTRVACCDHCDLALLFFNLTGILLVLLLSGRLLPSLSSYDVSTLMFALRFFPCSGVCRYAYLFMALVLVFILAVWAIWDSLSWSIGLSVYVFFVVCTCFPLWYSCLRSDFSRAATTAIAAATNWLVLCSSLPPTFWCWLKGHSLIPTWLRSVVAVWSFQEAFVFGADCGSPITLFNALLSWRAEKLI